MIVSRHLTLTSSFPYQDLVDTGKKNVASLKIQNDRLNKTNTINILMLSRLIHIKHYSANSIGNLSKN